MGCLRVTACFYLIYSLFHSSCVSDLINPEGGFSPVTLSPAGKVQKDYVNVAPTELLVMCGENLSYLASHVIPPPHAMGAI